ncbi:uncharacterized protein UV8b_05667 [Ustilaginoidea virens]|uniref:Ribonuclease H2 subunit B n=1 Tax=Ustilaginoidea virens TaxID=1159556 RepID=A0A063C4T6_USTVR|nr:uncharacterized protein UV8b_05667 [Ustilaginoidea virens]QUC21424.1 hypothetical protein UV8b_05667 [Ustilaginoidea virens]GAO16307.1 hypothetical protein UVI_02016940 [Ustilaginoidea virens]
MARTRSAKPVSKPSPGAPASAPVSKYTLEASSASPPRLFVLPTTATSDSRIITLPHPRNGQPARYLICPKGEIHEFTRVSAPTSTPKSWLVESEEEQLDVSAGETRTSIHAETISRSDMYIATPIDPLFLVLPSLVDARVEKGSREKKRLFLASDDHFDKLPQENSHLSTLLECDATRSLLESRMEAICDTVDAGDVKMFRLSEKKLVATILGKAQRMMEAGLPPSMEDKFVRKALEAPFLLQKSVVMAAPSQTPNDSALGSEVSTPLADFDTSQSTSVAADSNPSFASEPSTASTSLFAEQSQVNHDVVTALQATPDVLRLQRLRVAFDFICSRYVSSATAEQLRRCLSQGDMSTVDFSPLDAYLAQLAEVRARAAAASSAADYSRKRVLDDEQEEMRAEKKRKMEAEKQRKANQSRGVRDLKKVNTSGMMKLSHFFSAK